MACFYLKHTKSRAKMAPKVVNIARKCLPLRIFFAVSNSRNSRYDSFDEIVVVVGLNFSSLAFIFLKQETMKKGGNSIETKWSMNSCISRKKLLKWNLFPVVTHALVYNIMLSEPFKCFKKWLNPLLHFTFTAAKLRFEFEFQYKHEFGAKNNWKSIFFCSELRSCNQGL